MSIPKLDAYLGVSPVPSRRKLSPLRPLARSPDALGVCVAWWLVAAGMLLGAVVGLWSFGGPVSAPQGFESYGDVPRRLVRLAHIAMIALPVLYFEYVRHAEELDSRRRAVGSWLMLLGMTFLPAMLGLAAFVPKLLYALPIPVSCLTLAILLLAFGLSRADDTRVP